MKKIVPIIVVLLIILLIVFVAISLLNKGENSKVLSPSGETIQIDIMELSNTAWSYDEKNNIYYQLGLLYCREPKASQYENMAIFVPGEYFKATKNKAFDTYTCYIDDEARVGDYTPSTAPIVMPVSTDNSTSQKATSSYSEGEAKQFVEKGFIYVQTGYRGPSENSDAEAFSNIIDLKAAIRFLRYNKANIPANTKRLFILGRDKGGATSAILGTTGDSILYDNALQSIGALFEDKNGNSLSDSVTGVMCYNPNLILEESEELTMFNPLYYLLDSYRGYGTSILAKKWNLIYKNSDENPDNILDDNFYSALENCERVESVEMTTATQSESIQQELKKDVNLSFINWVEECTK